MSLELHLVCADNAEAAALATVCEESGWHAARHRSVEEFASGDGADAPLLILCFPTSWTTAEAEEAAGNIAGWRTGHVGTQLLLIADRDLENADRLAIDLGARHTLFRPWRPTDLGRILSRVAAGIGERRRRNVDRRRGMRTETGFDGIIGESPAMDRVLELARRVSASEYTSVMITGESGTGKGAVARAIHEAGPRADGPFVEVNCAAIPASLLESEFFGHEQGAFTDAKERKIGLFECASGGTIFLDEVGEIDYALQAKLLKFLDTRTIRRISGTTYLPVDVRVLAATNRDLRGDVDAGRFRADLFYRLNVVEIAMPPLRDRPEDIRLIAEAYTRRFAKRLNKKSVQLTPSAIDLLQRYRWPGNVRELINVIERAVLLSGGDIEPDDLPIETAADTATIHVEESAGTVRIDLPSEGASLEAIERAAILAGLEASGGNVTRAAGLLRVTRGTLRYKMKKYGIDGGAMKKNLKTGEYEPVLSN